MSKKRVLVIDDDPLILDLVRILLEDEGHEVVALVSGERAVEQACALQPDLVLLDIVMRGTHGMEVLDALRHALPAVPVVLLSGAVSQVDNMATIARALGAHDFIEKPFDAQRLLAVVNDTT
ncbi:MAG TPA: response regulator [Chloroflexota bacterium]|nr:response regulator [Chloroflexota bacterium]